FYLIFAEHKTVFLSLKDAFLKFSFTKILLFLAALALFSCNAVKRVKDGDYLLTKNTIYVDSAKISTREVYDQLYQQPNVKLPLANLPLRLYIYNAARPHPDSLFYDWLYKKPKREKHWINFLSKKQVERMGQDYVDWQKFKKRVGEAPVIVDTAKTKKSAERLKKWYWSQGYFNAETSYSVDTLPEKRATATYYVKKHQPYYLDSLTTNIKSKVVDSLYRKFKGNSLIRE